MDRLIVLRLGEPHRLLVKERTRLAEPGRKPRVIFQRTDATVDIDRRIGFSVARIGNRDRFVLGAVRHEHIGDRADQLGARRIAHVAQRALPFPSCERERTCEIEPARRGGRERLASDRIGERRLDTIPARPAAGQEAFQRLRRHDDLGC